MGGGAILDFLLTEEFWIEAIITGCISAAAVIIAGMTTWNYYWRKLGDDVKEVKDQANKRWTEHEKLSSEHQNIRDNMSQEYMDIKSDITQILMLLQNFKR